MTFDWFDADLIYFSGVCFSEEFVSNVADMLTRVKRGTRVISLIAMPERDHLESFATFEAKMSWGFSRVFYYRVLSSE